jgi:hypothetical protein
MGKTNSYCTIYQKYSVSGGGEAIAGDFSK